MGPGILSETGRLAVVTSTLLIASAAVAQTDYRTERATIARADECAENPDRQAARRCLRAILDELNVKCVGPAGRFCQNPMTVVRRHYEKLVRADPIPACTEAGQRQDDLYGLLWDIIGSTYGQAYWDSIWVERKLPSGPVPGSGRDTNGPPQPSAVLGCISAWQSGLPQAVRGDLAHCEPRGEVLVYDLQLRKRSTTSPYAGMLKPGAPKHLAGKDAESFLAAYKTLLTRIAKCPEASRAAAKTATAIAERVPKIEHDIAVYKAYRIAVDAAVKQLRTEGAAAFRKVLRCPKCSDDEAWQADDQGRSLCLAREARHDAQKELARLKQYGRRHGVVDLAELKGQSDAIRNAEESMVAGQSNFRSLTGHGFDYATCGQLSATADQLAKRQVELTPQKPTEPEPPSDADAAADRLWREIIPKRAVPGAEESD